MGVFEDSTHSRYAPATSLLTLLFTEFGRKSVRCMIDLFIMVLIIISGNASQACNATIASNRHIAIAFERATKVTAYSASFFKEFVRWSLT